MSFEVSKHDDITVIDVEGQLIVGNRQDLKQTVLDIGRVRGAQGWLAFDRFGDSRRPTYITTVRDGHFVVLER